MVSGRIFRRGQKILTSSIFTVSISVLVICLLIVVAVYFKPNNSTNQVMVNPQIKEDLVTKLISLPEEASSSSIQQSELIFRDNTPFQVMNLDSLGTLTDLPLTATVSARAIIFVSTSIPEKEQTKILYDYWKELNQSAIAFDALWLNESHYCLLLPDSTLVIFGKGSAADNLATLQQIRSHTTMTLNGAIVDLRFDKPVISENQISIE